MFGQMKVVFKGSLKCVFKDGCWCVFLLSQEKKRDGSALTHLRI